MSPQLYTRRDVRRLMAALGAFVAVPCALLVFLAWQSLHGLHAAAVAQRREALRRDVQNAGRDLQARLESGWARAAEPLRGREPATVAFWSDAWKSRASLAGLRTVLVLDTAGRPVWPRLDGAGGDDLPRLSAWHPAQAALQEARTAFWVARDPGRAVEFYKALLAEARVPEAVRVSVCAEQAQCEERLGDAAAALASYDRMLAEAREVPPSVWALLRAVELAREAGDGEREARWIRALLDVCRREGPTMELEALRAAERRLAAAGATVAPEGLGDLQEIRRLAAARTAAADFVRRRGPGPFPFAAGSGARDFESVALAPAAAELLLVDVRAPLAGGGWLAFEIDMDAWRAQEAEPLLSELARRWGGQIAWVATPARVAAPAEGTLLEPLPAPLDAWSLRYREEPIPVWAALAGTRTKGRAAILGIAAALALLGLALLGVALRRSLRLAGLQADVMDRISHELRTPIASLSVLADSLERHADGTDPAGDRRLRSLMRDEVHGLARLSDRLLDFARLRAGTATVRREPAALDEQVAAIVARLPAETGIAAERLAFVVEPNRYAGAFDAAALAEILRNLVENATKYSEAPAVVRIELRRSGNEATLAVSDRGRGMDARTLRHLFTPYFRGDASLAARVPGLGLGLAIVRGLVRAHAGTIAVRSAPGQGSTFEIHLPLAPEGRS